MSINHNNTLATLEPHGANIVLGDLLRWRLAAQHIPLENRRNSSQLAGGRRSTLRGRGIDFDEVRLYQAGDDVRAIDWRVTARTGGGRHRCGPARLGGHWRGGCWPPNE